ncbi:hypothetical protein [Nannocystis pusilla]|uniref:hypothetical protein n=1 Tax=Nannocystis pusilla TaxID=889268 RepID=UPI003DA52E63
MTKDHSNGAPFADRRDGCQHSRVGGHVAAGWEFFIPNDAAGAPALPGQEDWRFCRKCFGMFYAQNGETVGTVCPSGGEHALQGLNFYLPNDQMGATDSTGQRDWRFCGKCHGLFWAPGNQSLGSVCPAGGEHSPVGWVFYLPNDHQGGNSSIGQGQWRYCGRCRGLFYNGYNDKGMCPAP